MHKYIVYIQVNIKYKHALQSENTLDIK